MWAPTRRLTRISSRNSKLDTPDFPTVPRASNEWCTHKAVRSSLHVPCTTLHNPNTQTHTRKPALVLRDNPYARLIASAVIRIGGLEFEIALAHSFGRVQQSLPSPTAFTIDHVDLRVCTIYSSNSPPQVAHDKSFTEGQVFRRFHRSTAYDCPIMAYSSSLEDESGKGGGGDGDVGMEIESAAASAVGTSVAVGTSFGTSVR